MMKKLTNIFILLAIVMNANAQDVIVKKNGSTILSKVLEVNPSDVKYKKHSNPNGPTYTLKKSEIMAINYKNGDKDTFDNESEVLESKEQSQSLVQKKADKRNAEILALYNRSYQPTNKLRTSKKDLDGYLMIFGINTSSILSNEDLEVTFVRNETRPAEKESKYGWEYGHIMYNIIIKNKTNKVLYVDKGNSFCIWEDGSASCYYNPSEQTTVSSGRGSGASLALGSVAGVLGVGGIVGQVAGGVNVGGGVSRTVSTTYTQERILAIPPHGSQSLTKEKCVLLKKSFPRERLLMIEKAESFDFTELKSSEWRSPSLIIDTGSDHISTFNLDHNIVKMGQYKIYNENNSPYTRKYIITYSTYNDFHNYSFINAELFLHQIIGCGKYRKGNPDKMLSNTYIDDIDQFTIEGYYPLD